MTNLNKKSGFHFVVTAIAETDKFISRAEWLGTEVLPIFCIINSAKVKLSTPSELGDYDSKNTFVAHAPISLNRNLCYFDSDDYVR